MGRGEGAFINFFGVIHRLRTRLIQVKRMDCSRAAAPEGRWRAEVTWGGRGRARGSGWVGRLGIGGWIYRSAAWRLSPMNHGGYLLEYELYLQQHASGGRPAAYIFLINCLSNVYVNTVC